MSGLVAVLTLIVIITQLLAPVFDIASNHPLGPFQGAFEMIRTVTYWMLVPIFGLSLVAYLVFGPAQDELQRERRRQL
jgi:hypothetical protein